MVPRKTRAPGAGRKPQGEFGRLESPFSVRMPEDLRKQLEAAAVKSGRSASQELLRRLSSSFGRDYDKSRDPATRALCFLLAELVEHIRLPLPDEWHRNPFLFGAFKIGFTQLLDALEPKGKQQSPLSKWRAKSELGSKMLERWKSPRAVGDEAAAYTLTGLYRGHTSPEKIRDIWGDAVNSDHIMARHAAASINKVERTWYGMEQARQGLNLAKPETTDAKPKRSSKPKS
jgi:hypothetical protein